MSPSSCPVTTGSSTLDNRSNARPCSGSTSRPTTGRRSASSWKTRRRLAASVLAKASSPTRSSSAGRVRVSAQHAHSPEGAPSSTSQVQAARPRLAQIRCVRPAGVTYVAVTGSRATTRASSRENASAAPHETQTEFSKKTSWLQTSQAKERTRLACLTRDVPPTASPVAASGRRFLARRSDPGHVDPDVQHVARALGEDHALERRYVAVVAPPRRRDESPVDELVVGGVDCHP